MAKLLIVESPAKAGTIQKFLGEDFIVKSSFGHIRDLHDSELSIDVEAGFKPEYVIPADKKKVVSDLKKAAKEAFKKHLSGKKFTPKGFLDDNKLDEIKGIYVPYWLFSCDAYAQMTFFGEKKTTWSDSNYHYTKTDTYDVYREGSVSFDNVPVDASQKIDDKLMELLVQRMAVSREIGIVKREKGLMRLVCLV